VLLPNFVGIVVRVLLDHMAWPNAKLAKYTLLGMDCIHRKERNMYRENVTDVTI